MEDTGLSRRVSTVLVMVVIPDPAGIKCDEVLGQIHSDFSKALDVITLSWFTHLRNIAQTLGSVALE